MMVMRLLVEPPGRIVFDGEEIGAIMPHAFAQRGARHQMVFRTRPTP